MLHQYPLRDALIAFMDNLRSQQDILKEFTGLNDRLDSNLRSCILVLVQAHKLLIDVKQNSTSIFFRGKRYKNKIRQCQTNLQGIETRLFNAVHAELFNLKNDEMLTMNSQLSRFGKQHYSANNNNRVPTKVTGARNSQADEWCMTADRYYSGLGVPQSYEMAFKNYLRAALKGHTRAINCIGCMHQYGRGTQEDRKEAERWFRKACSQNDPDGMNNLGMLLEDKIASQLHEYLYGRSNAQNVAVRYTQSGSIVPKTMREIERLFSTAADMGHPDAMNNLGRLYEHADVEGRATIKRSYTKAFEWYEKAAKLGYSKGQVNLGSMYYSGRGLKSGPSYEMAAKLFQEAADQGDPIAQNNLGICYEIGRGVEKNKLEAMQLYERSAKSGNPSGMNNWGYMLVLQAESVSGGEDAPQYVQAVELFRAAIAAGDALDNDKLQMFNNLHFHPNMRHTGASRKRDQLEMPLRTHALIWQAYMRLVMASRGIYRLH